MAIDKVFRKGIIFLTANDRKINILEKLLLEGETINALIFPFKAKNENKIVKLISFAVKTRIPYYRPKLRDLEKSINEIGSSEFLITAGYPYILPPLILSICKFNINVHPTLLPRYRGPNIEWYIIANGEEQTGVTIHYLNDKADIGDIIEQKAVNLTKFDTVYSLLRKTSNIEPKLLVSAISKLRNGHSGTPQNEKLATTYPKLRTPEDSLLNPSKSLLKLYDFIRACDAEKFPAFFFVDGQKVGIKLFRIDKPVDEQDQI
ncbi:MAG: formyltransferase family protein [Cytophagales bacterium]|nr:formyltransferase family protein [Cytophagales bacterium]